MKGEFWMELMITSDGVMIKRIEMSGFAECNDGAKPAELGC